MVISRADKDIIDQIEKAMLLDEEITADNVVVSCENGKVTLDGAVDSLEESQRIEDIAENTPGVVLVTNNLKIRGIEEESI